MSLWFQNYNLPTFYPIYSQIDVFYHATGIKFIIIADNCMVWKVKQNYLFYFLYSSNSYINLIHTFSAEKELQIHISLSKLCQFPPVAHSIIIFFSSLKKKDLYIVSKVRQ